MKITVKTPVRAGVNKVWDAWNDPADIVRWNSASADWHTTRSTVDLRQGGKFLSRMEARDGSAGFDFEGTYTRVVPGKTLEYQMSDGREVVEFTRHDGISWSRRPRCETENPPRSSAPAGRPFSTASGGT
jgi:uncharacterized protein YndB with AHSA1/START domain